MNYWGNVVLQMFSEKTSHLKPSYSERWDQLLLMSFIIILLCQFICLVNPNISAFGLNHPFIVAYGTFTKSIVNSDDYYDDDSDTKFVINLMIARKTINHEYCALYTYIYVV